MDACASCAPCSAPCVEVRRAAETVSKRVLDGLAKSQQLCSENWRSGQSGERMVQVDLKDRISEVECWRGRLGSLSRSLQEQMRQLADENETLHVVAMRIQAEINHRALSTVAPGPRERASREPVEIELQEELKLLRTEKSKFNDKIFEVKHRLANLTKTKRAIDEDMQLKRHGIRVDREATTPVSESRIPLTDKKKKIKSTEAWQRHCRKLQEDGKRAVDAAVSLREESRAMRARLTCAAHTQAERVEAALRRRIHYTQNQLHDVRWQLAELDGDLERLQLEQFETENAIDSCLAQQRRARTTLARRATKPDSEHCNDAASQRLQRELARLKNGVGDLRTNLANIRSLRNTLAAARADLKCCEQDLQLKLQLDMDRSECRGTVVADSVVAAVSAAPSESSIATTTHRETTLNVIYESDECSASDE